MNESRFDEAGERAMMLPYPISTNRYWRNFKGRVCISREAKAYKAECAHIAKVSGCQKTDKPVAMTIVLYPRQNADGSASKICLDLDNALKVLFDALQGIAYDNDKQIRQIVAEISHTPRPNGAVEVEIMER